jgi:hypothetical protein
MGVPRIQMSFPQTYRFCDGRHFPAAPARRAGPTAAAATTAASGAGCCPSPAGEPAGGTRRPCSAGKHLGDLGGDWFDVATELQREQVVVAFSGPHGSGLGVATASPGEGGRPSRRPGPGTRRAGRRESLVVASDVGDQVTLPGVNPSRSALRIRYSPLWWADWLTAEPTSSSRPATCRCRESGISWLIFPVPTDS